MIQKSLTELTSIALDFGDSHLKIALIDKDNILTATALPKRGELADPSKIAATVVRKFLTKHRLLGFGISFAGIVNPKERVILSTNSKYQWESNFNLKKWADEQFLTLLFFIENDARLALLGETSQGIAVNCKNAVLFMLGTGVGTAAIIEARLLQGVHYQGGILNGHWGADIHGLLCNCGHVGYLEAQLGSWQLAQILNKIQQEAQESLADSVDFSKKHPHYKTLFDVYRQADHFAQRILVYLRLLRTRGVANLILAYNKSRKCYLHRQRISRCRTHTPLFAKVSRKTCLVTLGKTAITHCQRCRFFDTIRLRYTLKTFKKQTR